jgi:hypothetical protein
VAAIGRVVVQLKFSYIVAMLSFKALYGTEPSTRFTRALENTNNVAVPSSLHER